MQYIRTSRTKGIDLVTNHLFQKLRAGPLKRIDRQELTGTPLRTNTRSPCSSTRNENKQVNRNWEGFSWNGSAEKQNVLDNADKEKKGMKRSAPDCLNSDCKWQHYIFDCLFAGEYKRMDEVKGFIAAKLLIEWKDKAEPWETGTAIQWSRHYVFNISVNIGPYDIVRDGVPKQLNCLAVVKLWWIYSCILSCINSHGRRG